MTKSFSFIFLEPGDKVLTVHRRLFPQDKPRLFTGQVDAFAEGLLKVTGHSWYPSRGTFIRKAQPRTKILSLSSGTLIVYQLPTKADLTALITKKGERGQIILTDEATFHMDLSESDAD